MGSFDQKRRPQDMWPPITVATPHGTGGARLTAGKGTYKNGVHFFPLKLPLLYIFPLFPPSLPRFTSLTLWTPIRR